VIDPIGLAVIGPGAIADAHLEAFEELGGLVPLWSVGRTMEGARLFADRWGFAHFGVSAEDALADPNVSLVLICSPNALHADQARGALRAGKDVLLEIPIAMSGADARELVELADATGRRLFALHTMRSFAGVRYMRDLLASGEESISQIVGFFAIPRRNNEGFTGRRTWADNLLWHHACHLVDASLWISESDGISNESLLQGRTHPEYGTTMDISMSFILNSAVLVNHSLTYNASALCWQVRMVADRGDYLLDGGTLYGVDGEVLVAGASVRDLRAQNSQILGGLRTGRPTDFDARGVLPAMHALDLLQKASQP
jgi:2-hydroxy-4-carboxymuconate semialdehyde hemiacetal dehydrogenase